MDAETAVALARAYGAAGLGVAAAFLLWGIGRVMPSARGAWLFRPLMVPGVVLLWPLVLWRWAVLEGDRPAAAPERPPRAAQDRVALAMALALPAILALGLAVRQDGPAERAPVRIAPPEAPS